MRRRLPPDPRFSSIRVDAHFFDASLIPTERSAADELLNLAERGVLSIAVPHSVKNELDHPNTPRETWRRSTQLPFTIDTGMTDPRRLLIAEAILRGNARRGKHESDAAHVYDTALWQAGYFVTCDRRVLKKAQELAATFQDLWIVQPSQLLTIYEEWSARYPSTEA